MSVVTGTEVSSLAATHRKKNDVEEKLLTRMDTFLTDMETKLDYMEKYIAKKSPPEQPKLKPSPQLLRAWKGIKARMKSNREQGLRPLAQLLDTDESAYVDPACLDPLVYNKIAARVRQFDAKLEAFEEAHDILPKNPQQTLSVLKESLYNYEKALVAGSKRLLHFYELPFQWRENKFIVYGYWFSRSHKSAVKSICHIHNETANIWTHLLGAAFLVYLLVVHYPSTDVYTLSSTMDRAIIWMFFAAGIKCLLFSVVWHTYANISTLSLRQRFACFDYTGITILIIASVVSTEHIALREFAWSRIGFLTFSLVSGLAGLIFSWTPAFDKPESRLIRVLFFVSLAGTGVCAFFWSAFRQGIRYSAELYVPLLASFVWYLTGVGFYATLIPERWRSDVVIDDVQITDNTILELDKAGKLEDYLNKVPKRLPDADNFTSLWWVDYVLSSHNIWHVFVFLGIIFHYWAILRMYAAVL